MSSSHWGRLFLVSGATCAVLMAFRKYSRKEIPEEEIYDDEGSPKLLDLISPPKYTIKVSKIAFLATSLYLSWRLIVVSFRVGIFYALSFSTLWFNYYTKLKVYHWKLGSVLAAGGCFITSAYFFKAIGSEFVYYMLCNLLASAPAGYCVYQNVSMRKNDIQRRLDSFQDSEKFKRIMSSVSPSNIENHWKKRDPKNKGLTAEEVEKLVDELVENMMHNVMDVFNEHFPEGTYANLFLRGLPIRKYVETFTKMILADKDLFVGGKIKMEDFQNYFGRKIPTIYQKLKSLITETSSLTGAIRFAGTLNSFGT